MFNRLQHTCLDFHFDITVLQKPPIYVFSFQQISNINIDSWIIFSRDTQPLVNLV